MKRKHALQLAGGMLLAGTGLFIFLRDVDLARLWFHLRTTPWWVIAAGIGLTICTLLLRSVRWNMILPPSARGSRRGLFGIVMIGFMVNNFLPARLGEATRMLLLWKRNRFTVAQSVGSVALERVIDIIIFLSFFFIPALLLSDLRSLIPYAIPMALGSGAVLLTGILYFLFPSPMKFFFKRGLRVLPLKLRERAATMGGDLLSTLHWLFHPGKCVAMILISIATVGCHAVMMIIFVRQEAFGALEGMFTASCAALGAAIPLSPGYVGTLHAALKQGLVLCNVVTSKAIAVATLYHAIGYVTVTVFGLYYFMRMGLSFKDIGTAKQEIDREQTPPARCDQTPSGSESGDGAKKP
ncbi:MAG: flippase-like domain-containing protein [Chitinispirillaceae bacterium]|nr:flippase-like domain-containing protein [Chitinispirillaceae bacterium]